MKKKKFAAVWIVGTLACLVSLFSLRYFLVNIDSHLPKELQGPGVGFVEHFRKMVVNHSVIFLGHVLGGAIALSLGWFQFLPRPREQNIKRHRVLGRLYFLAVFVGGSCALVASFYAYGHWSTTMGLFLLAVLWLLTAVLGLTRALSKDIAAHRNWMIRNYALTFGAVTLRVWNTLLIASGVSVVLSYDIVAWLCWIPNLLVAEAIVTQSAERRPCRRATPL